MTFQFKIQLNNITDPLVWRRLLVPSQFTFLRMHKAIQAAFGWEDYHLFLFSPKGYNEMKTWLGLGAKQKWDAEAFDLEEAKKKVSKV